MTKKGEKKCWLIHDFDAWVDTKYGKYINGKGGVYGLFQMQERHCKRCNYLEGRIVDF